MKNTTVILLAIVFVTLISACKKDQIYQCSCSAKDLLGSYYYIDTVMASSSQEAKRKCDKLDYNYLIESVDCTGM